MGTRRGKKVNWSYLRTDNGKGRPRTIEFRQHAGTSDAREVGWWVRFVLGLVRLAHRYAGEKEPVVMGIVSWDDGRIGLEWLMAEMGLEEEGKAYFLEKATNNGSVECEYWREWVHFGFEDEGIEMDEKIEEMEDLHL